MARARPRAGFRTTLIAFPRRPTKDPSICRLFQPQAQPVVRTRGYEVLQVPNNAFRNHSLVGEPAPNRTKPFIRAATGKHAAARKVEQGPCCKRRIP